MGDAEGFVVSSPLELERKERWRRVSLPRPLRWLLCFFGGVWCTQVDLRMRYWSVLDFGIAFSEAVYPLTSFALNSDIKSFIAL